MKNSQKGFVVPLLIVVIGLLIVGGGLYIYENNKAEAPVIGGGVQQSNKAQQQASTQTLLVGTQPKSISIANWKTYTDTQDGFEVKYPIDGTIQSGNMLSGGEGNWVNINLWTSDNGALHPERKTMYIKVDEAASMQPCGDPFKDPDGTITKNLTDVALNGVEFTKGDVSPYQDLDLSFADEYCTVRNGNRYQIIVGQYIFGGKGPMSSTLESDSLINQAISTFKFTN